MASSLHAGMTVEQAVASVTECELLDDNIRSDFQELYSKLKLGIPMPDAFYGFAKMTGSKDAYDVATAVTIMTEIGGDAGVAIEKIQKNIEERLLYRRKRESLLTESKLLAFFSDIIPVFILTGTCILMPDTINAYFTSIPMMAVFISIIVALCIGSLVIRKMLHSGVDVS